MLLEQRYYYVVPTVPLLWNKEPLPCDVLRVWPVSLLHPPSSERCWEDGN